MTHQVHDVMPYSHVLDQMMDPVYAVGAVLEPGGSREVMKGQSFRGAS